MYKPSIETIAAAILGTLIINCQMSSSIYLFAAELKDVSCYLESSASNDDRPKSELKCLSKIESFARREGDHLLIKGDGDKEFHFINTPASCLNGDASSCIEYRLVEYIAYTNTVVIEVNTYEGQSYEILFRSTGELKELGAKPIFSPNKKRFISVMASDISEPNGLEIWTYKDSKYHLEWSYYVPQNEYEIFEFKKWVSPESIKLKVYRRLNVGYKNKNIEINKSVTGWKMLSHEMNNQ